MLILDSVKPILNGRLVIPFFLRSPVSMKTGTQVHIGYLRKENNEHPELVISPIGFRQWEFSYRITASYENRPGIVNELLKAIAGYGVNVLMHESGSSLSRDYHDVEIIVDMDSCTDDLGYTVEARAASLERLLTYRFIDRLLFTDAASPRLHVRPMNGLKLCYDRATHGRGRIPDTLQGPVEVKQDLDKNGLARYYVELPEAMRNRLLKDLKPGAEGNGPGEVVSCAMICDTRDRLLRAIFIPQSAGAFLISVLHRDEVGALAGITELLKEEFDILHCLTRPQTKERNVFEAVLIPIEPLKRPDWKGYLKAHLEEEPTLRDLHPKVDYPKTMGAAPQQDKDQPTVGRVNGFVPPIAKDEVTSNLEALLARQVSKFEVDVLKQFDLSHIVQLEKNVPRWRIQYLIDQQKKLKGERTVFSSFRFQETAMQSVIEASIKKHDGFEPCFGSIEPEGKCIRAEIGQLIERSKYFLSVWTMDKSGKPVGANWLIHELAVACALNKPKVLVIDERLLNHKDYARFFEDITAFRFTHHQPTPGQRKSGVTFADAVNSAMQSLIDR